MPKINVLFVCTGNICRSPTAEGIFSQLVWQRGLIDHIGADSAGTLGGHTGEPPDARAQATALRQGVDLGHLRARRIRREDYDEFHYIIAMDHEHLRLLQMGRPKDHAGRVQLFCDFVPHRKEREVADPYCGAQEDFDHVFELCREAAEGLLQAIVAEHFPGHAPGMH
jgi:protein-tyrosine phosphatase